MSYEEMTLTNFSKIMITIHLLTFLKNKDINLNL